MTDTITLSRETVQQVQAWVDAQRPTMKPLTIEQIKSMDYRGSLDEHIRCVRMTEAAHGIKEQS